MSKPLRLPTRPAPVAAPPAPPPAPDDLPAEVALLPSRDLVLFPIMTASLVVGRQSSAAAIESALLVRGKLLLVCLQRRPDDEALTTGSLHSVGTIATILRTSPLVDGRLKVVVQGLRRVLVQRVLPAVGSGPFAVVPAPLPLLDDSQPPFDSSSPMRGAELQALSRQIEEDLERYSTAGKLSAAPGLLDLLRDVDLADPERFADLLAGNLALPAAEAQANLDEPSPLRRLRLLADFLHREVLVLDLQAGIRNRTRDVLSRAQREHFLREELRQIQHELAGENGDEHWELRGKLQRAGLTGEAQAEADRQLIRLEAMPAASPEGQVVRAHLEWLAELPWQVHTSDHFDLAATQQILDSDHFGLDGVKARVLEYLSVLRLRQRVGAGGGEVGRSGPSVLCFVGPPGVGKTSLGRSIARALGRRFVRIMLGGVRDDAEIRGHRRTYVGAMPGRLIQGLRQAGARNPVLLLDELDKLCADSHGDPAAALLEVLDSEQNHSFRDHYLGVPFDLSAVLFVVTANSLDKVPQALRDRLEVIQLSGYTEEEKLAIAARHIVPRTLASSGLDPQHSVSFTRPALRRLIGSYTCEAGLRDLERQLAAVCRKIARAIVEREEALQALTAVPVPPLRAGSLRVRLQPMLPPELDRVVVSERALSRYLGPPLRRPLGELGSGQPVLGRALGLAWTPVGGEVLEVESQWMPGTASLRLTGQLGEVMRESAQTALSFARARAASLGFADPTVSGREIHVHVPAGAIPKDGPSAGVTLACALVSLLTDRPVRGDLAMTGELTLRGRVLAVGGIKEKILAARRLGVKAVIIPRANEDDLRQLPRLVLRTLRVHLVDDMEQLLRLALDATATDRHTKRRKAQPPRKSSRSAAAG
jgi:ATP-dependent Lon protease